MERKGEKEQSREDGETEMEKGKELRLEAEDQLASVDGEGVGVACLLKKQDRPLHRVQAAALLPPSLKLAIRVNN